MKQQRPKIGVDLDDTAWQFMLGMSLFHNQRYGTTHDGLHHFKTWHLHDTWECTKEEAVSRITEFVFSDDHKGITPLSGALPSLHMLAQAYDLIAITAREPEKAGPTLELVDQLFGNLFLDVHLLGHTQKKGDLCDALGVRLMIDDGLHNAESIGEKGIPVLLMDMPWNQGALPPHTTRVFHWDEIPPLAHELLRKPKTA